MRKSMVRLLSILLSIALFGLVLAGCGSNTNTTNEQGGSKAQTGTEGLNETVPAKLEKVTLNFYMMGDPPNDLDLVTEKINEKLREDLNTEVKFHYSTWSEWANKYNLMLTSGEPMDAVYAANWISYFSNTKKGSFLELDDLLQEYAPDLWELVPADKWDGTKVDGKVYGIPSARAHFVQKGVIYREDLRQKHNLEPITDIDSLEVYLKTLQEKEPGFHIPLTEGEMLSFFFVPTTKYQFIDSQDHYGPTMGLLVASPDNPSELVSIFEIPGYKEMLHRMKRWSDMGFVSKSILSFKGSIEDEFEAGKAAALLNAHLPTASGIGQRLEVDKPDWQIEWFPWNEINGLIQQQLPTQDMTAIPWNAKNPERALMVINKFMTDKSYYDLIQYGILGRNYNLTEDGALDTSDIPSDLRYGNSGWAWTNDQLNYKSQDQWSQYDRLFNNLLEKEVVNPFAGFAIDLTPVQARAAAVKQVYDQYVLPLHTGLVADVDAAYDQLMERLDAAGFNQFKEEIQKQLNDYLASR